MPLMFQFFSGFVYYSFLLIRMCGFFFFFGDCGETISALLNGGYERSARKIPPLHSSSHLFNIFHFPLYLLGPVRWIPVSFKVFIILYICDKVFKYIMTDYFSNYQVLRKTWKTWEIQEWASTCVLPNI